MKKSTKYVLWVILVLISCLIIWVDNKMVVHGDSIEELQQEPPVIVEEQSVELRLTAVYTSLGVPNINSSFKTWMDYRTVTNTQSAQYSFIHKWGWCDGEGFMRANGERDLGITDDYYMIALGSYYGTTVGTKYRITTDMGNVFYGVLCDLKDDRHTNQTCQYAGNYDVVEFLVDARCLNRNVMYTGSANVYMPLNGSISKIERIDFIKQ